MQPNLRGSLRCRGASVLLHGPTFFERDLVAIEKPPKCGKTKALFALVQQGLQFSQRDVWFFADCCQNKRRFGLNAPRFTIPALGTPFRFCPTGKRSNWRV